MEEKIDKSKLAEELKDCLKPFLMEVDTIEVSFKSSTTFFEPEKSGLKNNTIREIDWMDERFQRLQEQSRKRKYGTIRIVRAELPNDSFVRQIKHVAVWKKLMVITWRA